MDRARDVTATWVWDTFQDRGIGTTLGELEQRPPTKESTARKSIAKLETDNHADTSCFGVNSTIFWRVWLHVKCRSLRCSDSLGWPYHGTYLCLGISPRIIVRFKIAEFTHQPKPVLPVWYLFVQRPFWSTQKNGNVWPGDGLGHSFSNAWLNLPFQVKSPNQIGIGRTTTNYYDLRWIVEPASLF